MTEMRRHWKLLSWWGAWSDLYFTRRIDGSGKDKNCEEALTVVQVRGDGGLAHGDNGRDDVYNERTVPSITCKWFVFLFFVTY